MTKQIVSASELAESLLAEFINNSSLDPTAPPSLTQSQKDRFSGKARLYRSAIVLQLLCSEEKRAPSFCKTLTILEQHIFPQSEGDAVAVLIAINAARRDIGMLMTSGQDGSMFAWARSWLNELGIEETNPATLGVMAMTWTKTITTLAELVGGYDPR